MRMRSNQLIEACRFLACVMIVFTHVPFPSLVGSYIGAYSRFGVPFFLMLSGYYAYGQPCTGKLHKKLIDTLRIIFVGGTVCFIWNCINGYLSSYSFTAWIQPYINKQTVFNFLVFNRATFLNSIFYYLFMLVYIYTICIIFVKIRIKYNKWMLYAAIFLILISWDINHFTSYPWYYVGNVFFTGLPMFTIGYSLHTYPYILSKIKNHEPLIIIVGLLITCLEFNIKQYGNFVYLGQITVAFAILCYCLNNNNKEPFSIIVLAGTNITIYVMVIHCEIRDTLSLFLINNTYYFPIIVLVTSCIIAFIPLMISKKLNQEMLLFH